MDGPPVAAKIMIIRHAEKPQGNGEPAGVSENGVEDPKSLTVRGWQRAGALACLFARQPEALDPGLAIPHTIVASEHSPDQGSQRPLQTILPLARRLQIEPRTFKKDKLEQAAAAAQASAGIVLISWQHEDIHAIAQLLPCTNSTTIPQTWPGDRFDVVWVFDLDPTSGSYRFSQVTQRLLDGDQPNPIP